MIPSVLSQWLDFRFEGKKCFPVSFSTTVSGRTSIIILWMKRKTWDQERDHEWWIFTSGCPGNVGYSFSFDSSVGMFLFLLLKNGAPTSPYWDYHCWYILTRQIPNPKSQMPMYIMIMKTESSAWDRDGGGHRRPLPLLKFPCTACSGQITWKAIALHWKVLPYGLKSVRDCIQKYQLHNTEKHKTSLHWKVLRQITWKPLHCS